MQIIVVAPEKEQLSFLSDNAKKAVPDGEITAFVDPMLAIQHLVNNSVKLIFAQDELKYIGVQEFIRLARKLRPEVYITIISDKTEYKAALTATGADRCVSPDEFSNGKLISGKWAVET